MGFRSDFYSKLSEEVYDFDLDRDGTSKLPFLARQMADIKTFAPGSAVSLIRGLDTKFRNNEICEKEYFCLLLETALKKRIRIQEQIYIAAENCRNLFPYPDICITDRILPEDPYSNKRKHLFYRRIRNLLDSMACVAGDPLPGCGRALTSLSGLIMAEALVAEAKAWLYDSGFPVKQDGETRSRKIDRSFQLIDRFFDEKAEATYDFDTLQTQHSAQPGSTASANKAIKEEAETLFSLMCKDPVYSRVSVPVTIDPVSGTGLYIYGIESDDKKPGYAFGNHKELNRLVANEGYSCYYTIFEYRYSDRNRDNEYPGTGPGRQIYLQYAINENSDDECSGYPDIDDAWHDYVRTVNKKETYASYENAAAPQGCPAEFRKFFSDYEPDTDENGNDLGPDFSAPLTHEHLVKPARDEITSWSPVYY